MESLDDPLHTWTLQKSESADLEHEAPVLIAAFTTGCDTQTSWGSTGRAAPSYICLIWSLYVSSNKILQQDYIAKCLLRSRCGQVCVFTHSMC